MKEGVIYYNEDKEIVLTIERHIEKGKNGIDRLIADANSIPFRYVIFVVEPNGYTDFYDGIDTKTVTSIKGNRIYNSAFANKKTLKLK